VHVTARVVAAAGGLRRRSAYHALRRALVISLARSDFRIVSLAVRTHRIELVVEADDRLALARGMQGFQVAAAKHVNRGLGRRGAVFPDRYRAAALTTRAAVRAVVHGHGWRRVGWPETWLLGGVVTQKQGAGSREQGAGNREGMPNRSSANQWRTG